ncbi:MAG: hypothetical protein HY329_05880 [Chloroflexi bacterium]|nr:hypothetical protein [Chloroflexota bacterium]
MPSLLTDVGYLRLLHLQDTRTEARRWLEAELPEGTRIAVEGASAFERFAIVGPQIGMTRAQLEDRIGNEPDAVMARWQRNLVAHRPSSRRFELLLVPRLDTVIVDGQIRDLPDVSFYRQRDVPYLVASSWAVRDARTGYSEAFVASLAQSYEPVQEWRPSRPLRWDPFAWRLDYPAIRALVFAHPSDTVGPTFTLYRVRAAR